MSALIIEGGIYLLLFFEPFAFGGVEDWALGVLQIVTGVIVASWALEKLSQRAGRRSSGRSRFDSSSPGRGANAAIWVPVALFLMLVVFQLVPLPSGWIEKISPATHDLYSRTLPGYAEGSAGPPEPLPVWLARDKQSQVPGGEIDPSAPGLDPEGATAREAGERGRRTLSVYPFLTRQKLALLLCFLGLFAVAVDHFRTRESLERLLGVAVFSAFAVSVIGIVQKLTWNGKLLWIREITALNPFGPFVNRNSYAGFAGAMLPLAVCFALVALRQWDRGRRDVLPRLLMWSFVVVAIGGGIFLSLSRGGILSAVFSMAIVAAMIAYYGRGGRELAVLGILVVACAAFLMWIGPEKVIERVGTLSEGQSVPSFAVRVAAWQRAGGMIQDHPLVGAGLGTFRYAFMRYAPAGRGWWQTAHNEYVEIVCDTGLIGAFLVLAGLAAYLFQVIHPGRFRETSERFTYIGLLAGLGGLLFHSGVSSNLQVPSDGLLLVLLAGGLLALARRRAARRRLAKPNDGGKATGALT